MIVSGIYVLALVLPFAAARIWTIQVIREYSAAVYINADGSRTGFLVDVVDLVCAEGKMDCRVVSMESDQCWETKPGEVQRGGRALHGRWVDACAGIPVTVPRIAVFAFTKPFLADPEQYFYRLKGTSAGFNPFDLKGKTIGFWYSGSGSPTCVARQTSISNAVLPKQQTFVASTAAQLLQALQDGQIDASFGSLNMWQTSDWDLIEIVPNTNLKCTLAGNALMARKDSAIVAQWNVAFSKLQMTNKWSKLCKGIMDKHAHKKVMVCQE